MKLNLEKASIVSDFKPIEPGKYDFMITKAEEKVAKSSGNTYISAEASVLNDDGDEFGKKVWININENQFGADVVKSFLTFNKSPLANSAEADIEPDDLVGLMFSATVVTKKDNEGNPRSEARGFKPVNEEFVDCTIDIFKKSNTSIPSSGSPFAPPADSPF